MEKEAMKTDAVGNSMAKVLLGVKKNVPNAAARREIGIMKTSNKAKERAINFFHKNRKNEGKGIVSEIMRWQESEKEETYWTTKVKKVMGENNLELLLRKEKYEKIKDKALIKESFIEKEEKEIEEEIDKKITLQALRGSGGTKDGQEYCKIQDRSLRSAVANFRLGTYVHEAPKDENLERRCVLCGGVESVHHWFRDCVAVEYIKTESNLQEDDMGSENTDSIIRVANFLQKVMKKRKDSL